MNSKLIYWALAFLGSIVLALGGLVLNHQYSDSDRTTMRVSALEQKQSADDRSHEEMTRRLDRIEQKLDQIERDIR